MVSNMMAGSGLRGSKGKGGYNSGLIHDLGHGIDDDYNNDRDLGYLRHDVHDDFDYDTYQQGHGYGEDTDIKVFYTVKLPDT